jgi:hypothetical protein
VFGKNKECFTQQWIWLIYFLQKYLLVGCGGVWGWPYSRTASCLTNANRMAVVWSEWLCCHIKKYYVEEIPCRTAEHRKKITKNRSTGPLIVVLTENVCWQSDSYTLKNRQNDFSPNKGSESGSVCSSSRNCKQICFLLTEMWSSCILQHILTAVLLIEMIILRHSTHMQFLVERLPADSCGRSWRPKDCRGTSSPIPNDVNGTTVPFVVVGDETFGLSKHVLRLSLEEIWVLKKSFQL